MTLNKLYGGIEAGGTKFVCVIGAGPEHTLNKMRFSTSTPGETLDKAVAFFKPYAAAGRLQAIGLASFGPLDLDPDSPTFGFITSTPKPNWRNTNILGFLKNELGVPVTIDTDVNAAALAEFTWGASRGIDPSLYLTIGTGIGGGYLIGGKALKGLGNLEMGHIHLPHDLDQDPFPGNCPFHGDCFEGLASGPAVRKRFGVPAESLAEDDPFWEIEAGYIAFALAAYVLTLSPRRIVLGGGLMQRTGLFPLIRQQVQETLNGYVQHPNLSAKIDDYIVPPALGDRSGSLGALALAQVTCP